MEPEEIQRGMDWIQNLGPRIESVDDPNIKLLVPVLRPCIVEMESGWIFCKHPWVNTLSPFVNQVNGQYTAKFSMAREYLSKRDLSAYLFVVLERPWRYETLARWWERDKLSIDELRELLPEVWRDVEFPSSNLDHPLYLFEEAGFLTDDQEEWEKLPDPLSIYRGGAPDGISWTTELERAEWFSRRFVFPPDEPEVWEIEIEKYEVLAFFTGRGESEIVVNPIDHEPIRRANAPMQEMRQDAGDGGDASLTEAG